MFRDEGALGRLDSAEILRPFSWPIPPDNPLGLPNAVKGRVNAFSFRDRVAQFAAISPEDMSDAYYLRFTPVHVPVVVFLPRR
jgi:hypothetical protein